MLGVVVRISGLVSMPELNGTLGTVVAFVESSGRYNVRLLNARTATMPSLKPDNIEAVNPHYTGHVENIEISVEGRELLHICRPSRVQGVQSGSPQIDNDGLHHPQRRVGHLIIMQDLDTGVVEINDLALQKVTCARGKILFRRCHFSGVFDAGVGCGGFNYECNVTFENCVFESSRGSGVIVDNSIGVEGASTPTTSTCTMLNCVLRNNAAFGAEVR